MNHCRQWSGIFRSDSGAKFWQWARLCVDLKKFPDQSWRLLKSRVMKLVPEIHFQGPGSTMAKWRASREMSALISKICHAPVLRLNELVLQYMDLRYVPPEDLVGAIQRLEMVQFLDGWMTDEQAAAILTMAKESRLGRIKRIKLLRVSGISSVFTPLLHEAKLNNKLEVERGPMDWSEWE